MQYKQPRLINSVSVTMLFIALCAGYLGWRFFPAYWDAWTVDHHLQEGASSVYIIIRANEVQDQTRLIELRDRTQAGIVQAVGISDPNLRVELNIQPGVMATFTADYDVIVTLPPLARTQKLHFHRVAQADLKQVVW